MNTLTTKVHIKYPAVTRNVADDIIRRLSESGQLKIIVVNERECDLVLAFCQIVSRAGTDIEAAFSRLSVDKPNVVFVLHHTFNCDCNVPSSSRYEKKDVMMVDILFYEDSGLLECSQNNEAFSRARNYLKKYAIATEKHQRVVPFKYIITVVAAVGLFFCMYKMRNRCSAFPTLYKPYIHFKDLVTSGWNIFFKSYGPDPMD